MSPLLPDCVFVELTAVGDMDNGVNCDTTWSRVMTKKNECEVLYQVPGHGDLDI